MWFLHPSTDLVHQRKDDQCRNGVTDERRNDENQGREYDQNAVQTHALDLFGDGAGNGMQEAGGLDGFAERETASGENDDGPEEIVEVFLGQDSGTEEEHDRYYGDDSHVAKDVLQLMRDAPQYDGSDGHNTDEPLSTREFVLHRPDRYDDSALSRLEGNEQ